MPLPDIRSKVPALPKPDVPKKEIISKITKLTIQKPKTPQKYEVRSHISELEDILSLKTRVSFQ